MARSGSHFFLKGLSDGNQRTFIPGDYPLTIGTKNLYRDWLLLWNVPLSQNQQLWWSPLLDLYTA